MKHYFNWFMGVFLYRLSTPFYKISNFFVDIGHFLDCASFKFSDKDGFLSDPETREYLEDIVENCPACGNYEAQEKYGKCFTHRQTK